MNGLHRIYRRGTEPAPALAMPGPRALVLMAVGLVVALLVGWASAAIPLARANPLLAARIAPWNGFALAQQAEVLMQLPRYHDRAGVARLNRQALVLSPMQYSAARNLGVIELAKPKRGQSEAWFRLVGSATLREPITHLVLMNLDFAAKDYGNTVHEAEILLKQAARYEPEIFNVMTQLVDKGEMVPQLAARTAERPAWRSGFLRTLAERGKDFDRELTFLRALRQAGAAPTAAEIDPWLMRATGHIAPQRLYQAWTEFLPRPLKPAERFLRDGDFTASGLPRPFNWLVYSGENGFGERGKGPDGRNPALYLEFGGGRATPLAQQYLALAPGNYRLTAKIQALIPIDRTESALSLSCAGGSTFAVQPFGLVPVDSWRALKLDFTVPQGCAVQALSLTGRPGDSDQLEQLYLDDVAIQPGGPGSAKPEAAKQPAEGEAAAASTQGIDNER